MEKKEILEQLNKIFIDILDNESININDNTTAEDIEEWDSLNHIQLVVAIEKHFNIRFGSREIQSWNNIGDLILSVYEKQSNNFIL